MALQLMALEGLAVFTRSVNVEDQFRETLPSRPRSFSTAGKAERGEQLRIVYLCRDHEQQNGSCHLDLTVRLVSPKGRVNEWKHSDIRLRTQEKSGKDLILLGEDQLRFENVDVPGIYRLSADLTDKLSGKTTRMTRDITLLASPLPVKKDDKALFLRLSRYYVVRDPSLILPALQEYLSVRLPEKQASSGKKYSPLPMLGFFYFALKENPRLYPELGKLAEKSQGDAAKLLLFLASELGDEAWNALPPALRKQKRPRVRNPFLLEKAVLPIHTEILWSEFLCTGKKAPVLRIADSISGMRDGMTPDTFRLLKNPSAKDKALAVRYLTGRRSILLIRSQAKNHPLLFAYIEKMLSSGEIRDNFTKVMLDQILQDVMQDINLRQKNRVPNPQQQKGKT